MSYRATRHHGEISGRLLRVVVIDPDPKVKPEIALVYNGVEYFTDRTDEEIFIGLALPELLSKHNGIRNLDGLDPVRVGDLAKEVIQVWPPIKN